MADQNNQFKILRNDGTVEFADPSQVKIIPKVSGLRSLGDTLIKLGRGGVGAAKQTSNSFGANNPVSNTLDAAGDFLTTGLSEKAKLQDEIASNRTEKAKDGTVLDQLKAVGQNFLDQPIDTIAEGVGSIIPTAAAMLASKGKINPASVGSGLGVVQGAGAVKGSIYDQTKQEALANGLSPDEAEKLATEAQSYTGKNQDQIALGAGLGYIAGKTGAESSNILTGGAKQGSGVLRDTIKGFASEGLTEAAQGGQERFAGNLAVRREGSDTPLFSGVAGQAGAEGLAGGLTGGAFGFADSMMDSPAEANPRTQLRDTLLAQNPSGALTQAAATAIDTGASDQVLGLPNYVGEPLITFPDGTTMTRAEAEQRFSAEELAAFEARTGLNQQKPISGLLPEKDLDPYIVFADGSTGKRSEFDAYLNSLPTEAERMVERARFLGYGAQKADAQLNVPKEQAIQFGGLLQSRDIDPMIVYPDGSTGKRSEFNGYINSLPENKRIPEMARLLGYSPQKGGANVSDTNQQPVTEMATETTGTEFNNNQGSTGNTLSEPTTGGLGNATDALGQGGASDIQRGTDGTGVGSQALRKVNKYSVKTEDGGDLEIKLIRSDDGSVALFDESGNNPPVDYNKDFASNKTDEEIIKYTYEPLGFVGLNKTLNDANSEITPSQNNDISANDAATSNFNTTPQPTQAQKDAGNYKLGRVKVNGLDISVENPDGSTRSGVDRDGKSWESTMKGHYGYVKGVKARSPDKEHVDVNVKPGTSDTFDGDVFVINQNEPTTGKFDEPKVYIGYANEDEAESAYRSNYDKDWQGFGSVTRLPMSKFKEMLNDEKAFLNPVEPQKAEPSKVDDSQKTKEEARKLVETIVKRRSIANQIGKSKAFDQYLQIAKDFLSGKEVQPNRFVLASTTFKNDAELSNAYSALAELAKPQAKQARSEAASKVKAYKDSIESANDVDALNSIKKSIQADTSLKDNQVTELDDLVVDKIDSLSGNNKKKGLDQVKLEKEKINGHVRDFQRTLFSIAHKLSIDGIDNVLQFIVKHKPLLIDSLNGFKKDADPLQIKAIESMVADKNLGLSDSFWKAAFKLARENAGIDTSKKKKLENTGITLRRYWQLNKENVNKAVDWKSIEKVTARAVVFKPEIAEGAEENLERFIDIFRNKAIKTFGDWLEEGDFGRAITGRIGKGIIQTVNYFLNGEASLSRNYAFDKEERLQYIKDQANKYLNEVNRFNEVLSGAKTVAEFIEKYEKFAKSTDINEVPDWIEYSENESRTMYVSKDDAPVSIRVYKYSNDDIGSFNSRLISNINDLLRQKQVGELFQRKLSASDFFSDGWYARAAINESKKNVTRKDSLTRPRLDNVTRNNRTDHRKGRDITPQELKETFGLADVGFGQYVNAVQDQKHLNHAYDAFKDLAEILGLPEKAIGLGGKLHFTIGALGHGKAAAVYIDNQPKSENATETVHVINLTNTRGDGTVAHEWMHALDYHIMHYDRAGYKSLNEVRDALRYRYSIDVVTHKVKQFLKGTMYYPGLKRSHSKQDQAIYFLKHGSATKPTNTVYKQNADALGEDYWGNEREIWARAGEAYVYDQFNGSTSYYLVSDWVAENKVTSEKYRGTPYPAGEERKLFNSAFKAFFSSLDVANDGVKVNVDKFNKAFTSSKKEFDEKIQDMIENLPRYINDWEQEKQLQVKNVRDQDSERLIAEQKRREEERIKAEVESVLNPNNKTEPLSDDDLEAIFDEAVAELKEEATEQPDTIVGEPKASPTVYKDKQIEKQPASSEKSEPKSQDDKAVAKLVAEAAKLGVKGIDEALTGLTKLFGGSNGRLNSFPSGFDEEAYKKAKPHFEAALKAFVEAGKTLKDLFKFLIQNLGEGVKPYAIQFAKENGLGAKLGEQGGNNANEPRESQADDFGSNENQSPLDGDGVEQGQGNGGNIDLNERGNARGNRDSGTSTNERESESSARGSGMEAPNDIGSGDSESYGVPTKKNEPVTNFVIPQGGLQRQGSWRESAMRNLDIIELVKQLEKENRQATKSEQALLSKYVGFGASEIRNNLFPRNAFQGGIYRPGWVSSAWRDVAERADKLLTPEEFKTLLRSTQYAHYTSEGMTRGIWTMLGRFGFNGGNILEPGMGVGNFIGTLPINSAKESTYTGVEFDKLTATIAKHLYPESNVIEGDYTQLKLPDNYYDISVGNPPFADVVIKQDQKYKKYGFMIHDYFFAKSIDKVREGGLLVFVTSKGTMDKNNSRARKYLSERADLVGAIRFPQTAFKENAGTEVVTDVLILRKRAAGTEPSGNSWMNLKEIDTPQGKTLINEYFADNPSMILGQSALTSSRYGDSEYTVIPNENSSIEDEFNKAILTLPENIYSDAKAQPLTRKKNAVARDMSPDNKKEGGLYVDKNGNLMIVENGVGVDASEALGLKNKKDVDYLKDYVVVRDALKKARYDQWNDTDWEKSFKALNKAYDDFVKKHGQIKSFTVYEDTDTNEEGEQVTIERKRFKNWRLIKRDVEGTIVWALEDIKEDGAIEKAAALKGRIVKKPTRPIIETTQDALAVVLDEIGYLDLDKVAEYANLTKDKVISELGDLIFELPSGQWQMRDEYLSGYVIDKLEEAEQAAKTNPRFERNVKALLLVQPKPLSSSDISVSLGANWVPVDIVAEFARDVLEIDMGISYNDALSRWEIEGARSRSNRRMTTNWGTTYKSAQEILDAALNGKPVDVTVKDIEGRKIQQASETETAAANELLKNMINRFKSWIWTDAERAEKLMAIYNRKFNNIAPREFDGTHLTLPGVSTRFKLHPHQKRAIWRIIQTGNTYLAHAVGAGKTYEMIAAGMEQKRLGLINRPMYVVPNHMLEQFASEFIDLYPTANVMVADKDNFGKEERQRFTAQAAVNDPDAIIITHSAFKLLQISPENYDKIIQEQLNDLAIKLEDVADDRVSRRTIEGQIEKLESRLKGKLNTESKDNNVTFEDLGVDFLFVDEAHEFRKLDFATNRTKVKGINPNGSERAIDLYTKVRYLETVSKGRSHVFASGTPVTNTMGELYTVMRFFIEDEMKESGLHDFDAWASMFGEVVGDYEANSAGKYEFVERFAKFTNVPEMMKRVRQFMDVLTSSSLGTLVKRPNIVGGSRKIVVTPKVQALSDYMKNELETRIATSKKWKPTPDEPNNPDPIIAIIGDARLANIDMRFINPSLPNDPDSKLNKMIDGIIEVYHRTKDKKFYDQNGNPEPIAGATQIVFANVGFGDGVAARRGFSARDWVNKRLKDAGIKPSEIAWMQDYDTSAKKQAMFKEMKTGVKKVLFGSPKNMGTGTNVQKRLIALQYLDPPWYPSDLEQPEGRILRQGNLNEEIELYAYAVKGSYDSTMWQMVARKGKFTEQSFSGDDSVRTLEDISESSQYQMAAALASGDSRVIQLAELEAKVAKFNRLKDAHASEQRNIRARSVIVDSALRGANDRLDNIDEAIKKVGDGLGINIQFKVGNTLYKERAEFGEAVIKAYSDADKSVTSYGDRLEIALLGEKYPISAVMTSTGGLVEKRLMVRLTDKLEFTVDTGKSLADKDPGGLATRLINQVNRVRSMRYDVESEIEQLEREKSIIKSKIGAPFEYEQDLIEAIAEAAQLKQELAQTGDEAQSVEPKAEPVDDVESIDGISKNVFAVAINKQGNYTYVPAVKITDSELVDFNLYIHADLGNSNLYTVTEGSTGLAFARELNSQKEAVARAKEIAKVQGREKIEQIIFKTQKSNKPIMGWDEYSGNTASFSVSPTFYSQLTRAISESKNNRAPAGIWKAFIKNLTQKGVKQDEIEWTGINEWLDLQTGTVTKEQVLQYLDANGVQVTETVLGNANEINVENPDTIPADLKVLFDSVEEGDIDTYDLPEEALKLGYEVSIDLGGDIDSIKRIGDVAEPTKYSQYTVPGGENYKELLLTLPVKGGNNDKFTPLPALPDGYTVTQDKMRSDGRTYAVIPPNQIHARPYNGYHETIEAAKSSALNYLNSQLESEFYDAQRGANENKAYRSSHFDQPNILAHVRFDERTDADGNKVLFINELQSDWNADGRKKGFNSNLTEKEAKQKYQDFAQTMFDKHGFDWLEKITVEEAQQEQQLNKAVEEATGAREKRGVPRAPFVEKTDAYLALAIKRMMRYAAENGFDKVAFINGQQAADLYDLSKQIDEIVYERDNSFVAYNKNGEQVLGKTVKPEELESVVGKEVAEKILVKRENQDIERLNKIVSEAIKGGMTEKQAEADAKHIIQNPIDTDERPTMEQWTRLSKAVGNRLDLNELIHDFNDDTPVVINNADLKVGGEGMRTFYDTIVPKVANDVLKKLGGGKVGSIVFGDNRMSYDEIIEALKDRTKYPDGSPEREALKATLETAPDYGHDKLKGTQNAITITPAMREKIMGGLPLFRAQSLDEINAMEQSYTPLLIDDIKSAIKNDIYGHEVDVYAEWTDAPVYIQDQIIRERAFGAEGFFDSKTNRVALIASNLSSLNRAKEVARHELIGHYGIENMMNEIEQGSFNRVLNNVLIAYKSGKNEAINDVASYVLKSQPALKVQKSDTDATKSVKEKRLAKEIIAVMAERNVQNGIVKRVIDAVRKFLKKIGFIKSDVTDATIASLLRDARAYLVAKSKNKTIDEMRLPTARSFADVGGAAVAGNEMAVSFSTEDAALSGGLPETITVDGKQRPTLNSNGKPIHPTREGIENFWRWFGDSKVVDSQGRPLVVYHGGAKGISAFDPALTKSKIFGNAVYFSSDKSAAILYADKSKGDVYSTYLAIRNPTNSPLAYRDNPEYDGISRLIYDGSQIFAVRNPNQIKSAIGNTGSFDADNDSILFSVRSPQQVVSDLVQKSAMRDDILGKAMTVLSEPSSREFGALKNIRTQLDKARQDPKGFGRMFDAVSRFTNDARLTAARPAEFAPSILGTLEQTTDSVKEALNQIVKGDRTQADKQAVAKFLFEGTLTGGADVMAGKSYTTEELRAKGATDAQVSMYFEARNAVDASLDETTSAIAYNMVRKYLPEIKDDLMNNPSNARSVLIDALKELYDQKMDMMAESSEIEEIVNLKNSITALFDKTFNLKKAGYMPLSRFGKYSVTAYDESGEVAEFYRVETETEAKLKEKELAKNYARVVRGVMPTSPNTLFAGVDPDTVAMFLEEMDDIEGVNVRDELFQEWYRNAVSDRSALKRMIERKGIEGYSEDLERVLANFITSNSRFAAQNYNRADMLEVLNYLRTDPEYKRKGDVFDEAKELYDYVNNPEEPFQFGRSVMFGWFMGGSLASAAVNMTQPLTMTLPWLSQYAGVGKIGRAMKQASKLASAITINGKKAEGELGKALERAIEIGLVDPQETHHLFKAGAGGFINTMSTSRDLKVRMAGVTTLWGLMFGKAEQFNRYLTFITAYNLATNDTKLGDPFEFAQRAVEETQGIYGKNNRPNWARGTGSFGGIGAMAFTFKQYSIAYIEMITRMAKSGKHGKKAALMALGILFLLSGGMGLPFADDELDVLDTALQMSGGEGNTRRHLRNMAIDALGEDLGMLALYGVSTYMPFDIQGRMGMGNLLPATALFMPSNSDNRARSAMEILGASGSLLSDGLDAIQGMENGKELSDIATQFAPVAIKNAIKGMDMLNDGFYSDTRGRRVIDTTDADAFWKSIGFQPASVARSSKDAQSKQQSIARQKQKESAIAEMFARAQFEKDPSKADKARKLLIEWNEENPDLPIMITPRQIIQRVRRMNMTREERQLKATPRELRGLL